MKKKYQPEFLTPAQKKFIRRHKKGFLFGAIAFLIILSTVVIRPFVADDVDMKKKESAVDGVAQQLEESMPGKWSQEKKCVERSHKMETLPPVCHVSVSNSSSVSSEQETQNIIDSVVSVMKVNKDVSIDAERAPYLDLSGGLYEVLDLPAYEQKGETSKSLPFSVVGASDGLCSVNFSLQHDGKAEGGVVLRTHIECSKSSKLVYYELKK